MMVFAAAPRSFEQTKSPGWHLTGERRPSWVGSSSNSISPPRRAKGPFPQAVRNRQSLRRVGSEKVRNLQCPPQRVSRLPVPMLLLHRPPWEMPDESLPVGPPFSHAQNPVFPVPGSVPKDRNTGRQLGNLHDWKLSAIYPRDTTTE
jgi:hypothetical protein